MQLVSRDRCSLGVILLVDKYEGDFSSDDEALLVPLGQLASAALENAYLHEKLKEVDRQKDEFLAILAHELRNPLSPIVAAADLMRMRPYDHRTIEWARTVIERQVHNMARLVDDLLDVSRITRGHVELRKEIVDVTAILARAMRAPSLF